MAKYDLFLNNIGVTMIIQNWFIFCTILDYKKWKIYTVKKVSKHWFRAYWGKKLCQCCLSNCSGKSDLEFNFHWPANLAQAKPVERVPYNSILPWKSVVRDQYILWFLVCSWEYCVNGPLSSCVCLGLKDPHTLL